MMESLKSVGTRIGENHVVELHYRIQDLDGQLLDSSIGFEPITYLQGAGNIIQGLESALNNVSAGEKLQIVIPPSQGYGMRNESLVIAVPRHEFESDGAIVKGMSYQIQSSSGNEQHVIVVDVNDDVIVFDANHPLAGRELLYDVEVLSVRKATAAEIEAGLPLSAGDCGPQCKCYQ